MPNIFIYGLIDPKSNEIRYIGQSSIGMKRSKQHWLKKSELNNGTKVHNWCKKLLREKLEPKIVVLEEYDCENPTKEHISNWLNNNEILAIEYYRSIGCNLTNMTDGGNGTVGKETSDITKKKISKSLKGIKRSEETKKRCSKARSGKNNHFYGKKLTKEHKNKISEGCIGKNGKKVLCLNDGNIFNNTVEAGNFYRINRRTVSAIANGIIKNNRKNLKFRYVEK